MKFTWPCAASVSYTHLDVYKRQEEEQEDEDSELEDDASSVYWEDATPLLKQIAAVAYRTAKSELNVDTDAFEVSYNGPEDWYYPLEK